MTTCPLAIAPADPDPRTGAEVVREVVLGACDKSVLYMKHMAKHIVNLDLAFLARTRTVLLIRDPIQVLQSFGKKLGGWGCASGAWDFEGRGASGCPEVAVLLLCSCFPSL
jgi:hypothetical protein